MRYRVCLGCEERFIGRGHPETAVDVVAFDGWEEVVSAACIRYAGEEVGGC